MKFIPTILLAAMLAAISTSISSEVIEGSRTVKSGVLTQILIHSNYGNNCQGGDRPSIKLVRAPKHGTIQTGPGVETVDKDGNICDGKKIQGTAIYYKSDRGFTGTDSFTYHRLKSGKKCEILFTIRGTIFVE